MTSPPVSPVAKSAQKPVFTLIRKLAVVFHDSVRHEAEQFQELLRNAGKDIRLFQPERYEEALDWLKGDG